MRWPAASSAINFVIVSNLLKFFLECFFIAVYSGKGG